jgi:hypothetical protein
VIVRQPCRPPSLGHNTRSVFPSKLKISITNPTRHGARFTSLARARKYIVQECAKLSADGKRLTFVEDHHWKQSVELSARETLDQEFRLSARGYDGRETVLTLKEISHLPAVRPVVLATKPTRIRRPPTRHGAVKILMQNGIPVRRAAVMSIGTNRKISKIPEKVEAPKAA